MPATKRKGSGKQAGKSKQAKQDGQRAISHSIEVPVDEGFEEQGGLPIQRVSL